MNILNTLLQVVATILMADFLSGFFHWLEDAYGHEAFPVTGRLFSTTPNILHHHNPRYFVRHSWLQSSWDLALFCALIVFVAWLFGLLSWHVWLFSIFGRERQSDTQVGPSQPTRKWPPHFCFFTIAAWCSHPPAPRWPSHQSGRVVITAFSLDFCKNPVVGQVFRDFGLAWSGWWSICSQCRDE